MRLIRAWSPSIVLIVAGGVLLYFARVPLSDWLAAPEPEIEDVAPAPLAVAPTTPADTEPAPPPPLTRDEIALRLEGLPERTLDLALAGRDELPEFTELGTADEVRAQVIANRWRSWGGVWKNRVRQLVDSLPPLDQCQEQFDFRPTCDALERSLALLASIPSAETYDDATARIDGAVTVLERYFEPPPEEDEEVDGEDGAEEDDPADG
ncbi:MAG: hypothetical protein AAGD38_10525 [Acidobacteriota bacterium]